MFNSQPSSFIGGGGDFSDPSSDLAFMGEDLEHHHQFGQLRPTGFSSILDPPYYSDPSVNFQSTAEGIVGEFSSYGTPAMPAIYFDLAAAINLNLDGSLFHHEYGVYHGCRSAAGSHVRVMEEGYGGQLECSKMENKRGKGVMRVSEEFGQKNEKQRRERLGKKFEVLKSLIPNSTKPDRASIISDTIDYIKELQRTVDELKILVGKKRSKKERCIKLEMEDEAHGDMECSSIKSMVDESDGRSMRSSWIQRRAKATFIDVRIIEDEVFIKLTQRKRANFPLIVSRVLDELQLDLMHLSGGNIGDNHIFTISTKANSVINEGPRVYASSVARRFVEIMDG